MVSKLVKQLPSGKGSKKSKTVVKTILENPFSLKWPIVDENTLKDVSRQLELSCSGLNIPVYKPPWSKVRKLKGEERVQYCQQYRKDALEELLSSPDSAKKYELAKEGRSHLIMGYNAVMKSLEKNELAGILIKRDAQPSFLGQTFLPGCISKRIPFVCLDGLDDILHKEETLGLMHGIMVLGLKPSVRESDCRFYPLYESMMKVLHSYEKNCDWVTNISLIENGSGDYNGKKAEYTTQNVNICDSSKENRPGVDVNLKDIDKNQDDKERNKPGDERKDGILKVESVSEDAPKNDEKDTRGERDVSKYRLSPEEIKSYHLKRTSSAKRAFVPLSKQTKIDSLEEIIYVGPSKVTEILTENHNSYDCMKLKSSHKDEVREEPQNMDLQLEFYIDTEADENAVKQLEKEYEKQTENVNEEKKKCGTTFSDIPYIPAQAKRVKNNPNRETKKVKH